MFSTSNWPFSSPRKPRDHRKPTTRRPASAWTQDSLRDIAPAKPGVLLSVQTVAERYDISTSTVRRLIRDGALPTVSLGPDLLRVPEIALTYLAERSTRLKLELY